MYTLYVVISVFSTRCVNMKHSHETGADSAGSRKDFVDHFYGRIWQHLVQSSLKAGLTSKYCPRHSVARHTGDSASILLFRIRSVNYLFLTEKIKTGKR